MCEMENITSDDLDIEKLLKKIPKRRRGRAGRKKGLTTAAPVIEVYKIIRGKKYYWYRRGTDPPIYLGSAEKILKQCKLAT